MDHSDFSDAKSLSIDFQIVLEGYTYSEAVSMLQDLTNEYACSGRGLLNLVYDDPTCVNVTRVPLFHRADPFVLPPASAGAPSVPLQGALSALLTFLVSTAVYYFP